MDDLFTPEEPYTPSTTAHYQPEAKEMDEDDPEEALTMTPSSDEDSEPDSNDDCTTTAQESTNTRSGMVQQVF